MPAKPVGLLWDSVSNNIGDQAIGLAIKKFCASRKIKCKIVDPFSYDINDYLTMIIGGGELIRSLGDPFYDQYRVPGQNILNSVGVHHPSDMEYLLDYRMVAVRSELDRIELKKIVPELDVKVSPCTTILFKELFPELEEEPVKKESPIIGVHINAAAVEKLPNLIDSLKKINHKYRVQLIPFTLYQNDQRLLKSIQCYLPNSIMFSSIDPMETFKEIGKMDLMISSSLHAVIYSYANAIPFLAYPVYPKISHFLSERGLDQYLYQSSDQLEELVERSLDSPLDYTHRLGEDKNRIRAHLDEIETVIKDGKFGENAHQSAFPIKKVIHNPVKIHHTLSMEIIKSKGDLISSMLDNEIREREYQRLFSGNHQGANLDLQKQHLRIDGQELQIGDDHTLLVSQNSQLSYELEQAKDEISHYVLSKSWRITRPFRKIALFLKRMKYG